MKTLVLIRHGKSSWDDDTLPDVERPINSKGKKNAQLVAHFLEKKKLAPTHIIVSSAKRTKETAKEMQKEFSQKPEVSETAKLYMASPDKMLEIIKSANDENETLALIAHQPSLSALTRKLSKKKPKSRLKRAYEHFPTAAAAVFEVDIERWSDLDYGAADFVKFVTPKDL